MASVVQIQANRLNAQKSTGPRTAEGKATAARNAVKHGLLAEQVVIHGEDPEEFDRYRAGMLAELAPIGVVETILAERAVSLAWRLRRAERLQSAVFATVHRENADDIVLWPKHGLPIKPGPDEDEVVLGQVVMTDFARAQVLDRLLVYERRIESSLYRTMAQLRREREVRAAAARESARPAELGSFHADVVSGGVPPLEGGSPAGRESVTAAELGSFGADVAAEPRTRETACERSEPLVGGDRGADMGPPKRDTARVGTELCVGDRILPVAENHGRDARATKTLHDPSCETKPISERKPACLG
jgi:hypothetical protein